MAGTTGSSPRRRSPPLPSDAVLERLTRLHPKLIDLGLDRIERLLAALGNPERRLPPVVHVAGTNGKGSAIAFLKAICEAAGLTAHVYVSPHLIRFAERIALCGRPIGEAPLEDALAACETANGGAPITFFEITTAAAFLAFSRVPADIALIETGLGGRFDATNVLARPALTVITPISRDHVHFLGETIPEIAFEKAGILKPGVPAVIGKQLPEASATIAARAGEIGAPLRRHGAEWECDGRSYRDAEGELRIPPPGLAGAHQLDNAGIAVAAARALGWPALDEQAIRAGIAAASWPGRLQRLQGGALSARLGPGWELWVDGGHNPAAAEALARVAASWADRKLHLVMGHLAVRPAADFLAPLAPRIASFRGVPVPGAYACHDAEALAEAARGMGLAASASGDVAHALDAIAAAAPAPARVLVCGSLYLAGSVLAEEGVGA